MESQLLMLGALMCTLALLAGCEAGIPARPGDRISRIGATGLVAIIEYGNRLRELSPQELEMEYKQRQQAFRETHSREDGLRLALLLSTPTAPVYDKSQALLRFGEVMKSEEPDQFASDIMSFARLCSYLVGDELSHLEEISTELRVTKLRLESSQAESVALQSKLEALQRLEKQLQQRIVE